MRWLLALPCVLSLTAPALPVAAQTESPAGAWRGNWTMSRPDGREARAFVRLNVQRADSGLAGTVGWFPFGTDVKLDRIVADGDRLRFAWRHRGAEATFDGRVAGGAISGTVSTGGRRQPLALERIASIPESSVAALAGVYRRDDGHRILLSPERFVLNVYDLDTGEYAAFFPRDERTFFADRGYRQIAPATQTLRVERGRRLVWTAAAKRWRLAPSDEVRLDSLQLPNGDVSLGVSIFRPGRPRGPAPGMVVAVGSGRQARFGGKGLNAYRAAWLALHGVVALVHDKRGSGTSTGTYESLDADRMASDLVAGVEHLASLPEVDRDRIGIMVHSQSGIFAPEIIRGSKRVSRAVVLSSTVVNGETQEIVRTEQQLRADGFPQSEIDDAVATQILKFHYADHRIGWDAYVAAYQRVKDREWFPDVVGSTIDPKRHSWDFWRKGNAYEPSEHWREVSIPSLFLFGEHDILSPVRESIALLEQAFSGERRGLLTVEVIPGATHDLFAGENGGLYEEVESARMSDFMTRAWKWLVAGGWESPGP